jgi:hypothetical protein
MLKVQIEDEPGEHYTQYNNPTQKCKDWWSHLHAESKTVKLIETETGMMGWSCGVRDGDRQMLIKQ